jgi:tetraacyldisaccharide 4'-kinase
MNLNNVFLKSFRIVLLPFALLYGVAVIVRNWLFDKDYIKSIPFNFPLICVGNIAIGGTGKSPMVEYLIDLLHTDYKIATLSRGYKRKTKGYLLANEKSTALDIGDESMQFLLKYPTIPIAVGEERLDAIPQLLHDKPNLDAIILDDAFQHRDIKPGLNIILTEYSNLYVHDFFFPTGDLRDQHSSMKRAEIIVITKCPTDLWENDKQKLLRTIKPLPHQRVFCTTITYGLPYHILNKDERTIKATDEVFLVCGIANPKPIKEYLHTHAYTYYQKNYSDHHIFSIDDLRDIKERYESIDATEKFVLTTEKDAVRLVKFADELAQIPIYVLPIKHKFLFNEGEEFNKLVISFINSISKPQHNE